MKEIMTEKRKDLFKNTYRSSMNLTIDYVFHAVFGGIQMSPEEPSWRY